MQLKIQRRNIKHPNFFSKTFLWKKMVARVQQFNIRPFENEILCHKYVHVNTNPIIGNRQPGSNVLEDYQTKYNAHLEIQIKRNSGSL